MGGNWVEGGNVQQSGAPARARAEQSCANKREMSLKRHTRFMQRAVLGCCVCVLHVCRCQNKPAAKGQGTRVRDGSGTHEQHCASLRLLLHRPHQARARGRRRRLLQQRPPPPICSPRGRRGVEGGGGGGGMYGGQDVAGGVVGAPERVGLRCLVVAMVVGGGVQRVRGWGGNEDACASARLCSHAVHVLCTRQHVQQLRRVQRGAPASHSAKRASAAGTHTRCTAGGAHELRCLKASGWRSRGIFGHGTAGQAAGSSARVLVLRPQRAAVAVPWPP